MLNGFFRRSALAMAAALLTFTAMTPAADWPQLQNDAARTGRTKDTVLAPYRARWIWMGPDHVLRNRESRPGDANWTDDLTSGEGKNYRMPRSLPFSFAGSMQPIVVAGRVFVGDAQGSVYAISGDDGSTLWTAPNPGGTLWNGVATDSVVAFPSVYGYVTGYDAATGRQLWRIDTGRTITCAPALLDGVLYVANHGGQVFAIQLADGKLLWTSQRLGGPIQGGLCVANGRVYVGVDTMYAVALDIKTGQQVAARKVTGQSFRFTWPVAVRDRVIFTTVGIIVPGSEYVNDPVLAGKPGQAVGWVPNAKPGHPTPQAEEEAMRAWLAGDGSDWELFYSLRADNLQKDYIVAAGAIEGCGSSPEPPVIDWQDRPLIWWATAYPTFTKRGTFGSSYSVDISAFDLNTGRRILIDNGRFGVGTTETDNLYGLTIGGDILYLRQNFRGTQWVNLRTSEGGWISAVYRYRDGGGWPAPINYANGSRTSDTAPDMVRPPSVPAPPFGRVGPTIADNRLYFTEDFAVTCAETAR